MDATLNGVMQEAIEYANDILLLPLYPVDDHYDKLLALYTRIRQGDLARIFWEDEGGVVTQRIFLDHMQRAAFVMVGFVAESVAGAFWVEGLSGQGEMSRCELGGWMPFVARGAGSEHVLKKALTYMHETLGIGQVFMRSPWRTVHSLCGRAGLDEVASIDQYYVWGKPETLKIFRSDPSGW